MTAERSAMSSTSRSKLDAFRYAQGGVHETANMATTETIRRNDEAEKENHDATINRTADKSILQTKQTEREPERDCPQTPLCRIPLADLISNTEDAFSRVPVKVITPDDHVFWQHVPRSTDPDNETTTPAGRGKKRHHSSSPSSSPLNANSKKEAFNWEEFHKLLKSPQHDIAGDLWSRYVAKHAKDLPEDAAKPLISHLTSCSPQTPAPSKGNRDSPGLRRSISCNVDWPTSRPKRRCIDGERQANNVRGIFARSKSALLEPGTSKVSKISLLVEKIQESLLKAPREDIFGPSSSSPLPERCDDMEGFQASPAKTKIKHFPTETPSKSTTLAKQDTSLIDAHLGQKLDAHGSSSEFGDDDLDNDLLELATASATKFCSGLDLAGKDLCRTEKYTAPGNSVIGSGENNVGGTAVQKPHHDTNPNQHPLPRESHVHANVNDDDEFGDDDDDFPDDMEEILAQYDRKDLSAKQTGLHAERRDRRGAALSAGSPLGNVDASNNAHSDVACGAAKRLSGDEFDDDIDLEALEDTLLHTAGAAASGQNHKFSQAIKRYLVLDFAENAYMCANGRTQLEKVLLVQDEKTKQKKSITLRESWFDSPCVKGSYIHLIGNFNRAGQCVVDDSNNMIILHPDYLISVTVLADSFTCQRRAVLQDRVKATSDASKPQVYGHILHEIFQEAMKANRWDSGWLNIVIKRILVRYVESLYEIHVELSEAADDLMAKMTALSAWGELFLRFKPSEDSVVADRNGSSFRMSINKLLEVEEHIWSPMYGLKGNIDATVQVAVQDGTEEKTLTVPLEVKTGRNNTNESHRAQTALYSLLISDRYNIDVTFGILYYLEATKTFRIRAIPAEIRQMIQQRNRQARYTYQRSELPPMLQKPRICDPCYAKTTCFVYHKLVDDGDGETSGMGTSYLNAVSHLTTSHQTFFRKWDELLTKEEKEMMKFRRELWTMLSNERESVGRCFGSVMIEPGSAYEDNDGPKINRFRYTFVKHQAPAGFSFGDSQITTGEPIVISDEEGHFALANGYVLQISRNRITVAVDRKLDNTRKRSQGFDAERNQVFTGIMEISGDKNRGSTSSAGNVESRNLYRLDKDEFNNGMATARSNLVHMMDRDLFRARELRSLIVDGTAPSFKPSSTNLASSSAQTNLNVDQIQAIEKVMSAEDYALVLGMPGTGKTTTIAHIIRALVSQGKSVLLTSYTHTAVDNILLKIRDDNIRTLRLGAIAKIHPEVHRFADLASVPKKTIEELRDSYENSKVVATTCLGINHPIFNNRTFDYCIVDEASQITLPVCLGPIRMAKTFILVGDHYQLPPLVQNKGAQEGGLDVSLFKLLCDSHPSSVVNLEHQYRMCADIMLLSNTLIYSGHLKCGTPTVAARYLKVPNMAGLSQHHMDPLTLSSTSRSPCLGSSHGRCWLRDMVEPASKTRLINTDHLNPPAPDFSKGSRIVNPVEAMLCAQLVEAFISVGIPAAAIGVVTLYRSQLSLLKQNLRHRLPDLEMHTADRFQGRDKEVIIMSCVRSNSERNVGDLLRDWRRVNVAFTRARTKMLIVGSKNTLRDGSELLRRFVKLMDEHEWTYDLPPAAVESHTFEDLKLGSSQWSPPRKFSLSPQKSPTEKRQRVALSPTKTNSSQTGKRRPEKIGGRRLDGAKIIGKRPVLRDVLNDAIG